MAKPPTAKSLRQWHRYFGLLLTDHLAGSPFTVKLEMDLSRRRQMLDVVIVRREPGEVKRPLPDGLDDLAAHNLITFKSHREPLDDWALKELTGHYVNYRKQVSPRGRLVAEDQFRLYAVCARHPRDLFAAAAPVQVQPGVFNFQRGSDAIRIVVAAALPKTERNALLHLFSAGEDRVQYGAEHYQFPTDDASTILNQLVDQYRQEGLTMPYTMEDFRKEIARENLDKLTPEERLEGLSPEQRLAGMTPVQIEAYLNRIRKNPASPSKKKPKPKK